MAIEAKGTHSGEAAKPVQQCCIDVAHPCNIYILMISIYYISLLHVFMVQTFSWKGVQQVVWSSAGKTTRKG
jgi:hypothetical protein